MLLLLPGFSFPLGPQDFTALLLPKRNAFLRDYLAVLRGIGGRLEPRPLIIPGVTFLSSLARTKRDIKVR